MDYATRGAGIMSHQAGRRAHHYARPGYPVVGWTSPPVIYDRMRHVDAGVHELNGLMETYVKNPLVLAGWRGWLSRWRDFFSRYQNDFFSWGRVTTILTASTDELAVQTEDYRQMFDSFRATYAAQRGPNGEMLPQPGIPVPSRLSPGDKVKEGEEKPTGLQIPWWFWVLGGVGVSVGGYFLYKKLTRAAADMRAKRAALDGAMPSILQGYGMPQEISRALMASSDPNKPAALKPSGLFSGDASPCVGRDCDPAPAPVPTPCVGRDCDPAPAPSPCVGRDCEGPARLRDAWTKDLRRS